MATGGYDSMVKLWDFQGLTKALKSFKEFQPVEEHIVHALSYNSSGSHLLVCPGNRHARMYDQNGEFVLQTVGGDVYVRDQMKTTGHTAAVVSAVFDPEKKDVFYTAAQDCTIRSWDSSARTSGLDKEIDCTGVWRVLDARGVLGKGCFPTSMALLPGVSAANRSVVVGCSDGSIQVVNVAKKAGPKPDITLRQATPKKDGFHAGEVVFILPLGEDRLGGRCFASRGMDGKILLWNLAVPKAPVAEIYFPTEHETANLCMSPCGRLLLACSAEKVRGADAYSGVLKAWDLDILMDGGNSKKAEVSELPLPDGCGGLQVAWHGEIDQLFVTLTNGKVLGCWDERSDSPAEERRSKRGLLLSVHVEAKKEEEGAVAMGQIWTEADWDAAGYREGRDGELRLKREFRKPKNTQHVEAPGDLSSKWGAGGALATGGTLTDYLVGSLAKQDARSGQEDAQKALQEYQKKMDDEGVEPTMIYGAYKETQPVNILNQTTWDDLDDVAKALQLAQKCPSCGLKLCSCPPALKNAAPPAKRQKRMDNWD